MSDKPDAATLQMSPRSVYFRLWSAALPPSVCDAAIVDLADETLQPSHIQRTSTGTSEVDAKTRSADHVFLDTEHWVGSFATHFAHEANKIWNFDLTGDLGTLSYVRYDVGGHFTWHVDTLSYGNPNSSPTTGQRLERKLSVTINLSDEREYDGGDLEFVDGAGRHLFSPDGRTQGSVTVFPSTVGHRVTPVTRGVRHVLVAWLFGPQLR